MPSRSHSTRCGINCKTGTFRIPRRLCRVTQSVTMVCGQSHRHSDARARANHERSGIIPVGQLTLQPVSRVQRVAEIHSCSPPAPVIARESKRCGAILFFSILLLHPSAPSAVKHAVISAATSQPTKFIQPLPVIASASTCVHVI